MASSVQFISFHRSNTWSQRTYGYGDKVRIKNLKTIYIRTYCTVASLEGENKFVTALHVNLT
jgi:hypothetical protein